MRANYVYITSEGLNTLRKITGVPVLIPYMNSAYASLIPSILYINN